MFYTNNSVIEISLCRKRFYFQYQLVRGLIDPLGGLWIRDTVTAPRHVVCRLPSHPRDVLLGCIAQRMRQFRLRPRTKDVFRQAVFTGEDNKQDLR